MKGNDSGGCRNLQGAPTPEESSQPTSATLRRQLEALGLIGRAPRFLQVFVLLKKFSRAKAPTLILGETGTGKELAARALHYLGERRGKPFVPVNCSSFPDALIESELFGHRRGAFTDAKQDFGGLIGEAEGGTLFLDEVNSLSLKAQATMLRFLQEGVYRPVGASREVMSDVHIVAATNAPLENEVASSRFRQDLYYRLDVARVEMPPLRDRRSDIPLLADHFLRRLRAVYEDGPSRFSPAVLEWIGMLNWRGNIRELENFVHREFLKSDGDVIDIEDGVGMGTKNAARSVEDYKTARNRMLRAFDVQYIRQLLEITRGNITRAAELAHKERRAFGRLLKKYSIDRREFKSLS